MFFYLRNPYSQNPQKRFKHWPLLMDDLFLNHISIKTAAEKWGVSMASITKFLRKNDLYEFYAAQVRTKAPSNKEFIRPECAQFRKSLQELYANLAPEFIQYMTGGHFERAGLSHILSCNLCKSYEKDLRERAAAVWRLDCPSLKRLIEHHQENTPYDAIPVRHMQICMFCKMEYAILLKKLERSRGDPTDLYMWIEEESEHLYPIVGWRNYLNADNLREIIHALKEGNGRSKIRTPVSEYLDWRNFRNGFRNI